MEAHQSNLEVINIDSSGKYLVTSSETGTLVRIFDIETNKLIKELRRGSDRVKIVDLKFSENLKYLLCSSIKGTIHIFNTMINSDDNQENTKDNNISLGYGTYYFTDYLPQYFSSEWSFTQFYLDKVIVNSIFIDDKEIVSIGDNGNYYVLSFENNKSTVVNTFRFVSDENDPFNDRTTTIK